MTPWAIATPALLLSIGCGSGSGKDEAEELTEQCISACEPYADFMIACGFELGATKDAFCTEQCSGASDAVSADCSSEFAALTDCSSLSLIHISEPTRPY